MTQGGTYQQDLTYCDGTDATTISNLYCDVPLLHLQDVGGFALVQGDLVVEKVAASNSFGQGEFSEPNTSGSLIETVPHAITAPTRGSLTHELQVHIEFDSLVDAATGGSPILSYVVLWDEGNGDGSFTPLVGDSEPSLQTSIVYATGI